MLFDLLTEVLEISKVLIYLIPLSTSLKPKGSYSYSVLRQEENMLITFS